MSFEFDHLREFELIFEESLEHGSGGWVGSFEEKPEV
jgi:hypothetical protein